MNALLYEIFILGILGMLVGLTLITFFRIKYDDRLGLIVSTILRIFFSVISKFGVSLLLNIYALIANLFVLRKYKGENHE